MQINPGWNGSDSIPVVRTGQLFVPAGLFSLYTTSADNGGTILLEVVGKVLCKDMEM